MIGEFRIKNLDDVQLTLTCTMTVREWRLIESEMNRANFVSSEFTDMIKEMISRADLKLTSYDGKRITVPDPPSSGLDPGKKV